MVASLLELAGLDWPVPDFRTVCRRQKTLTVNIPYRPGTGALHLLIDSTLGIDAKTLETRAIEVTRSRVGGSPMLPDLLERIAADPPPGFVTSDGAHDPRDCRAAIAARRVEGRDGRGGGTQRDTPQVPPPWPGRLEAPDWLPSTKSGRSLDALAVRSNRWRLPARLTLLGEPVMSRDFDRRVAVPLIRAASLNRFTALGTPIAQRAGLLCPGKGKLRPTDDLRNKACATRTASSQARLPNPPKQANLKPAVSFRLDKLRGQRQDRRDR